MVILVIDEYGVLSFESKGEPPIAIHFHRPVSLPVAAEKMQVPSRRGHIRRRLCPIQGEQLDRESFRMFRLYTRLAAGQKKLLQAGVSEGLYHV